MRFTAPMKLAALALLGSTANANWDEPPECALTVDMMFLQDFSDSSSRDWGSIQLHLVDLMNKINNKYEESRIGLGTFVDHPIRPLGYPYEDWWFEGDWCLDVVSNLEYDGTNEDAVQSMINAGPGGGDDWPENQLGAMLDVAQGPLAKWNMDSHVDDKRLKRVMVVSTQSLYHVAGDGQLNGVNLYPNNADGNTVCGEEDYPTISQVAAAITARDTYIIFLIGNSGTPDVYDAYVELVNVLNVPGAVYRVNQDSSNLSDIMELAMRVLEDDACSTTVDVMFSQDITYSYTNDMSNFQNGIADFANTVGSQYTVPRIGLSSFGDKPILPFGSSKSGDYCYRIEQPLSFNLLDAVEAGSGLTMRSGLDWFESQLDAMIASALTPQVGWRLGDTWNDNDLVRVLVLGTDSLYHSAGDAAKAGHELLDHDGSPVNDANCLTRDYPSVAQVGNALSMMDIQLVIVSTSDIDSHWRKFVNNLIDTHGLKAEVVEIKDFSDWAGPAAKSVQNVVRRALRNRHSAPKPI